MQRHIQAFFDGVYTGGDPIGTLLGYTTQHKHFNGYLTDRYSLEQSGELILNATRQDLKKVDHMGSDEWNAKVAELRKELGGQT